MYNIALFLVFLGLGYGFGQMAEKRHYRRIVESEKALNQLPAIASRFPPHDGLYQQQLVMGSVVIASDYFKVFLASLANFFGGSVVSYETLLDRGRREAVLRMKQQAKDLDAELVFNVKFETMTVGGRAPSIEVLAYGTALYPPGQLGEQNLPFSAGVGESASRIIAARLGTTATD